MREPNIMELLGKQIHVIVDRPVGYLHGDLCYPINYGYIPGLIAGDGEEQDVYILGVDVPVAEFDGTAIAVIQRRNDCEDKLVVAPAGMRYHQGQIADAVRFQERYFDSRIISCFERSCGVLPYRVNQGKREFLLVLEAYSKCWSIPKGHVEPGESDTQAALRELYEETGLDAVLDPERWGSIEYSISAFARKEVRFFLGEVHAEPVIRAGEIDGYRWVAEDQLQEYLFTDFCEACKPLLR